MTIVGSFQEKRRQKNVLLQLNYKFLAVWSHDHWFLRNFVKRVPKNFGHFKFSAIETDIILNFSRG